MSGSFKNQKKFKNILINPNLRYSELPSFGLYAEQVIEFINKHLEDFIVSDVKLITTTMINNYVKNKVLPPPIKKKYYKDHIIYLIVITILKQVLSISDIAKLIEKQKEQYTLEKAYNFFCSELDLALQSTFGSRNFAESTTAQKATELSEVVRSALLSFTNKIYVCKSLCLNLL